MNLSRKKHSRYFGDTMKKILVLLFTFLISFFVSACAPQSDTGVDSDYTTEQGNESDLEKTDSDSVLDSEDTETDSESTESDSESNSESTESGSESTESDSESTETDSEDTEGTGGSDIQGTPVPPISNGGNFNFD